jgi:hypothetical protein
MGFYSSPFTFDNIQKINYLNRCRAYNIYKDVLVLLDEDFDSRIYNFIDSLSVESKKLCAVMENEGSLFLLWHDDIPEKYNENNEVIVKFKNNKKYLFDLWQITKSVSLNS